MHQVQSRIGQIREASATATTTWLDEKVSGFQISLIFQWKPIFQIAPVSIFMGEKYFQEFGPKLVTCLQLVGTWVKKYFQELGPKVMTYPQLVGTWVKHIFRNLVPTFLACRHGLLGLQFEAWSQISDMPSNSGNMGEKYVQEFGPMFYG